jgi:plasmid replication initiation protein
MQLFEKIMQLFEKIMQLFEKIMQLNLFLVVAKCVIDIIFNKNIEKIIMIELENREKELVDIEKVDGNMLIKKDNGLIDGKYAMTLHQAQFVSFMISLVRVEDEDFKDYEMPLNELLQIMNIERKNWRRLTKSLKSLMQKVIILNDTEKVFSATTLLNWFEVNEEKDTVIFSFHKSMKPLLLNLKNKFTQIDLKDIFKFKSVYTIKFYEIIKRELNIHKHYNKHDLPIFGYELEELKEIMVGDYNLKKDKVEYPTSYKIYNRFKDKVLLPAQKELKEKCKYYFDFEEKKLGRKVNKLTFFVRENENYNEGPEENKESCIADKNIDELKQEKFKHEDFLMLDRIRNEYVNKPFFRPYHMRGIEGFETYMPDMTLILKETENKPLIINGYTNEPLKKDDVNAVIKYLNDNPKSLGDIIPDVLEYVGLVVDIKVNGKYSEVMRFKIIDISKKDGKDVITFENEYYTFGIKSSDVYEFVRVFFHNIFEVDLSYLNIKKDVQKPSFTNIIQKISTQGIESLTMLENQILEQYEKNAV